MVEQEGISVEALGLINEAVKAYEQGKALDKYADEARRGEKPDIGLEAFAEEAEAAEPGDVGALKAENERLEEELRQRDEQIADLEGRVGVQDQTLRDFQESLNRLKQELQAARTGDLRVAVQAAEERVRGEFEEQIRQLGEEVARLRQELAEARTGETPGEAEEAGEGEESVGWRERFKGWWDKFREKAKEAPKNLKDYWQKRWESKIGYYEGLKEQFDSRMGALITSDENLDRWLTEFNEGKMADTLLGNKIAALLLNDRLGSHIKLRRGSKYRKTLEEAGWDLRQIMDCKTFKFEKALRDEKHWWRLANLRIFQFLEGGSPFSVGRNRFGEPSVTRVEHEEGRSLKEFFSLRIEPSRLVPETAGRTCDWYVSYLPLMTVGTLSPAFTLPIKAGMMGAGWAVRKGAERYVHSPEEYDQILASEGRRLPKFTARLMRACAAKLTVRDTHRRGFVEGIGAAGRGLLIADGLDAMFHFKGKALEWGYRLRGQKPTPAVSEVVAVDMREEGGGEEPDVAAARQGETDASSVRERYLKEKRDMRALSEVSGVEAGLPTGFDDLEVVVEPGQSFWDAAEEAAKKAKIPTEWAGEGPGNAPDVVFTDMLTDRMVALQQAGQLDVSKPIELSKLFESAQDRELLGEFLKMAESKTGTAAEYWDELHGVHEEGVGALGRIARRVGR